MEELEKPVTAIKATASKKHLSELPCLYLKLHFGRMCED